MFMCFASFLGCKSDTSHKQTCATADIVLLVPYVGQLFAIRRCLAKSNLRMVTSERDKEEMERDEDEQNNEGGEH